MAEKGEWLGHILNSFKKIEVPIGAELFDEMVRRWKKQNEVNLTQGRSSHAAFRICYADALNKQRNGNAILAPTGGRQLDPQDRFFWLTKQ